MQLVTPENASFIATLVGLICNWKQERGAHDQEKFQSFMSWLVDHNFREISEKIFHSDELQSDLNALLKSDLIQIAEKLDIICEAISTVALRIDGFSTLVKSVNGENQSLSDQACAILEWFAKSGAIKLVKFYHAGMKPHSYRLYATPKGGSISPTQERFVESDLQDLLDMRFIELIEYTNDGNPVYGLTRFGERFAQQLGISSQQP